MEKENKQSITQLEGRILLGLFFFPTLLMDFSIKPTETWEETKKRLKIK